MNLIKPNHNFNVERSKISHMKKLTTLLVILATQVFSQVPNYLVTKNNNAPKGYYMFAPIKFTQNNSGQFLLDSEGDLVYYRDFPTMRTYDFKRHANGKISYFDSFHNYFIVMDSLFNNIDTVSTVGYYTDVHDLIILPNGNYMIMGVETTIEDLSAYHMFKHHQAPGSTTAKRQAAVIQELDSTNTIVFQWHANTHFPFDSADPFWLNDSDIVDWTHSNALEPDTDGNILMSSRHFDEITKIDRRTGAVLWRFGGKYNQFTFIGDTTRFYGQHDVRRLKNGHITLFDNGNHFTPHPARACEYELDEEAMTAKLVWSYIYDSLMYSNAMGNVQRIPNHQTLVNYGAINTNSVCFNVVDSLGQEVFNISFPTGLYSYRSFYYPGMPWAVHQPTVTCFDSLGVMYLKAQSGLSNYRWNTGSQSQIIPVTSTGNYVVNVPDGANAYVFSDPIVVNDIAKFCNLTGLSKLEKNLNIRIYPNPANNMLFISFENNTHYTVKILDVSGKELKVPMTENTLKNETQFDVSELNSGLYFVQINNQMTKFIKE